MSDTGYGPESITRISTEIENFVKIGMEPIEALRSATTIPAELLNISDRTGKIKKGLEADLIVIQNNPWIILFQSMMF